LGVAGSRSRSGDPGGRTHLERLSSRDGYFQPESVIRRLANSPVVPLLGGGPAVLLQVAHPLVAAGVVCHSDYKNDLWQRLLRTLRALYLIVYGSKEEAERAGEAVRAVHAHVHGVTRERLGPFPAGTPYSASDPDLMLWVHATLVEASLAAQRRFLGRLTADEEEAYYREMALVARLFGLPEARVPATLADFHDYLDAKLAGPEICVTAPAREVAHSRGPASDSPARARARSQARDGGSPPTEPSRGVRSPLEPCPRVASRTRRPLSARARRAAPPHSRARLTAEPRLCHVMTAERGSVPERGTRSLGGWRGRRRLAGLLLAPVYRYYVGRLRHEIQASTLPAHVAVILDGNRRWASLSGLQAPGAGHRAGANKLDELLDWCARLGIEQVTVWALSNENLAREDRELIVLLEVIADKLEALATLHRDQSIRIRVVGRVEDLPERVRRSVDTVEAATAGNDGLRLNIAVGYSGRDELVDASRALVRRLAAEGVSAPAMADHITGEALARHLYTAGDPDPDLIIRTSGEARLSGFLPWQGAHSELYFTDVYWPAFREVDFLRALRSYQQRHRRFGR
jgi:short-chain Z-isoprenyl diphosphate synthase